MVCLVFNQIYEACALVTKTCLFHTYGIGFYMLKLVLGEALLGSEEKFKPAVLLFDSPLYRKLRHP